MRQERLQEHGRVHGVTQGDVGREPCAARRLGQEAQREGHGHRAQAQTQQDGQGEATEQGPPRTGDEAQRHPERHRLNHELQGQGGEGEGEDHPGDHHGSAAAPGRPHQRSRDEGGEGQRLQEDVEVQAGQGEPAERVDRAGQEGRGTRRPELAGQPVGREGSDRQVQGQQPRDEDRAGPEDVKEVRRVEGRELERPLEDEGVPAGEAPRAQLAGGEHAQRGEGDGQVAEEVGPVGQGRGEVGQQGDGNEEQGEPPGEAGLARE